MNDMMDPSLPPNEKAAYDYMLSYSPYDNLHKGRYPAILVTDPSMAARYSTGRRPSMSRACTLFKTDGNPLLLRMKMNPAGHAGASGRSTGCEIRRLNTPG
jgi:oligopeptidase B